MFICLNFQNAHQVFHGSVLDHYIQRNVQAEQFPSSFAHPGGKEELIPSTKNTSENLESSSSSKVSEGKGNQGQNDYLQASNNQNNLKESTREKKSER